MATKTLLADAQQRRDAAAQRQTDSTAAVQAAQSTADTHRQALAALTAELVKLAGEIAGQRRALAEDLTPAELDARVEALRAKLVVFRGKRQALVEAEEDAAVAEDELQRARAAGERAGAALAAAEARLAAEKKRAAGRQKRDAALAAEPLASLKAAAHAARHTPPDNKPFTDADARVKADIPQKLLLRALERYQAELDRVAAARQAAAEADAALVEFRKEHAGPDLEVAEAQAAFDAAEAAFADYVVRGPDRLKTALGLLAGIVASPPLTAAEKAAITERATAGEAAIAKEAARDQKAAELDAARAALEQKKLDLLNDGVKVEELPDHPDVVALEAAVGAAAGALQTAEAALSAQLRADFDAWEASVPDGAWANLLALQRAAAILDQLANAKPADLAAAVAAAEDALVAASEEAASSARTLDFLAAQTERRRRHLTIAESLHDRRLAGAVRGDA